MSSVKLVTGSPSRRSIAGKSPFRTATHHGSLSTDTPKAKKPAGRLGPVSAPTPTPNARRGAANEQEEVRKRRLRARHAEQWANKPSSSVLYGDFVNVFEQKNVSEAMIKFRKAMTQRCSGNVTSSTTMTSTPGGPNSSQIQRKMNKSVHLVFRDDDEKEVVVKIPNPAKSNDVKVEKLLAEGVEKMSME